MNFSGKKGNLIHMQGRPTTERQRRLFHRKPFAVYPPIKLAEASKPHLLYLKLMESMEVECITAVSILQVIAIKLDLVEIQYNATMKTISQYITNPTFVFH